MDGLNIYRPDEESEPDAKQEQKVSGTYLAYFKEPVLLAVGIGAAILIFTGGILVFAGKKEKEP